jgi:hypothetical protein
MRRIFFLMMFSLGYQVDTTWYDRTGALQPKPSRRARLFDT